MLPVAFLIAALIALFFTAFGTAIASLLDDMQGFQLIMNFVVMPTFFLSGALFPLQGLPSVLETVARLNPLAYGVDGLREALAQNIHFSMGLDLIVLSLSTLFLLSVGSALFARIEV